MANGVQDLNDLFNASLAGLSQAVLTYHVLPGIHLYSWDSIPVLAEGDLDVDGGGVKLVTAMAPASLSLARAA